MTSQQSTPQQADWKPQNLCWRHFRAGTVISAVSEIMMTFRRTAADILNLWKKRLVSPSLWFPMVQAVRILFTAINKNAIDNNKKPLHWFIQWGGFLFHRVCSCRRISHIIVYLRLLHIVFFQQFLDRLFPAFKMNSINPLGTGLCHIFQDIINKHSFFRFNMKIL